MAEIAFHTAPSTGEDIDPLTAPWQQADMTGIEVLRECEVSTPGELGIINPPDSNEDVRSTNWD